MPDYFAGFSRDDYDGGDGAQGGEDVAVRKGEHGVDEGPVFPGVVRVQGEESGV